MSLKRSSYCLLIGATLCLVGACRTKPQLNVSHPNVDTHAIDALRTTMYSISYDVYEQVYLNNLVIPALPIFNHGPKTVKVQKTSNGVRYIMDNGDAIERRGGTIAWRNNNPGCIRYTANAVSMGAIGKAGGFAIFPDEQTGMRAIETLLLSEDYRDLTIARAITKYAPPHENNTTDYISHLCYATGLNKHQKIRDLNDSTMTKVVHTIRKLEGWIEGTETVIAAPFAPDITHELDRFTKFRGMRQLPIWATKTL